MNSLNEEDFEEEEEGASKMDCVTSVLELMSPMNVPGSWERAGNQKTCQTVLLDALKGQ